MSAAKVVALFLKPGPNLLEEVQSLSLVAGSGIEGDKHFGRPNRQALFISTESLIELGYGPGVLREQVTVDLPGLQSLPSGTKVKVGDVTFEIEKDCAPCASMAERLNEDPDEFKARAASKRGMFAKPLSDGRINKGDHVVVLEQV